MLLLLNVNHQYEAVIISDTFGMVMVQCESFLMIIFCGEAFAIDVLFKISLFTSVLDALTSIFDRFGINMAKRNKIEYTL